ncbi:MAG: hypothetical protein HY323_02850 [Betaproteobacteria bacterium]|nr:hypothetical protein [Betaproteobacteria bacterium]
MKRVPRILAMIALLAAVLPATAAEPQRAGAMPAAPGQTRQAVEQKEAFLRRLLGDSPVASRIAKSGNAEAQKFMAAAREHHAKAAALLQGGDAAGADRALNEALWMTGKARQLVPDTMYRLIEQRVRYARLLETVESLKASYERHLARLTPRPVGGFAAREQLDRITQLVDEARNYANSEQVSESVAVLERAEQVLLVALNRVLGSATIEYSQQFETFVEEFEYEMARNRSYGELIPLALRELKPPPEAARLIQRYVESNIALRGAAQRHAAKKDYHAALASIRDGTGYLQRALASAGLVVPQGMNDQ